MAEPVHFSGANRRLGPPPGQEETCGELHTYTNGVCSVSCWRLSPAEIAEVQRSGLVFVSVFSGHTQPPVFIGTEAEVRGLVVDFGGVWRREDL